MIHGGRLVIAFWAMMGLAAGLSASAFAAEEPAGRDILKTLRPGHPRLFVTSETLPVLRRAVQADPAMKDLFARLRSSADRVLGQSPVEHKLVGPRLLGESRRCLDRVSALALVHLLSGEEKYAARAARELQAAAAFKDWNPSHFLDTAEMSCAFGVGYDWLYAYLSKEQRDSFRAALIEKGLRLGLESYRGTGKYGWWTRARHNWSQVCNGGLAVGALAIADEEPALAREVLESGLKAVLPAMANFGPDGSWNEGPGYWGYTLQYTSHYLGALETALGSMMGLEKTPGLAEAGVFRVYFVGPTGKTFNFADAHEGAGSAPSMFWLARTFKRPLYAWHHRPEVRPAPLDLVWYAAEDQRPAAAGLPLSKHFRRDDVVFMRSTWEDPRALWVGLKGGDNAANHSHLDLGSFVLDAQGQRWAEDLGSDDYNLPAYFGNKRWTYYRLKTESHNTLLLGGENQNPRAKAPVVAFAGAGADGAAVVDLSAAWPAARRVQRGVAMLAGRSILVEDEVEAAAPVEVLWGMVTRARVTAQKQDAVLEQRGARLYARILAPADAVFDTVSANPQPPEAQQRDATKLVVRLPDKVTSVRLAVALSPDSGAFAAAAAAVKPLAQWPGWTK
ncbi:MAG: hypothetical protein FJ288_09880 [Planctomycetes bacterium]|nr:hypothetical protein [Planctomycetota bacterium]